MNHASYCKRVEWMLPLIWWIKIYINIYMSQTTLNGRLPLNWMRRVAVSTEPNSCQSVPVLSLSVDKQTDGRTARTVSPPGRLRIVAGFSRRQSSSAASRDWLAKMRWRHRIARAISLLLVNLTSTIACCVYEGPDAF